MEERFGGFGRMGVCGEMEGIVLDLKIDGRVSGGLGV